MRREQDYALKQTNFLTSSLRFHSKTPRALYYAEHVFSMEIRSESKYTPRFAPPKMELEPLAPQAIFFGERPELYIF